MPLLEPRQLDPFVWCPTCQHGVPFITEAFGPYFSDEPIRCPECKAALDWWAVVLNTVSGHSGLTSGLALAGAQTTVFQTTLRPGEEKGVNLVDFGVPPDADILTLHLTSMGSALPIMVHENDVLRDPVRPLIALLGRAWLDQPGDGPLQVIVTWFIRKEDDTTLRHLVEAARHYEAARYDSAVVPANIAAEAAITPAVKSALEGFASRKNLNDFLENGATYAHQLNVLLPIVAKLTGTPPLPDHIRGLLNRLRGFRNDIAHEGRCSVSQTRTGAAEHLAAAIFGVQYAHLLRSRGSP